MATCDVKQNTINKLIEKKQITPTMEIIGVNFNPLNKQYSELARTKYGVTNPGLLFTAENRPIPKIKDMPYNRTDDKNDRYIAIPNDEMFQELQDKMDNPPIQEYIYGQALFYDEADLKSILSKKIAKGISNIESQISFENQKERALRIGINDALSSALSEKTIIQNKETGQLYIFNSSESAEEVYRGEKLLSYYEDGLDPSNFFLYNFDPVTINNRGQVIADDVDKISPIFGLGEQTLLQKYSIVGEVIQPSDKLPPIEPIC